MGLSLAGTALPFPQGVTHPSGTPSSTLARGAIAGRYVIDREIGRGGMGVVAVARDIRLGRQVAIKMLMPPLSLSAERRARFLREARLMAGLSHPGIVPVFEFGDEGDVAWFTMDLVRGESAAARLKREGAFGVEEACRILLQVASALEFAHARGVTHRDIKPDNILLDAGSGRAMLADFGVAIAAGRGLQAARTVGTVLYMPPEWLLTVWDEEPTPARLLIEADRGTKAAVGTADARGDLYSLGITAFEMLAGRVPFTAGNAHATALMHVTSEAPDIRSVAPHVPAAIAAVIARCLVKDPARRWPSAAAFAAALDDALAKSTREGALSLPDRDVRLSWFDGLLARTTIGIVALAPYAVGLNALGGDPVPTWRLVAAFALLALVLPMVVLGVAIPMLRCHRLPLGALVRLGFRQPRWWLSWWPTALRRRDSLWHRLPVGLRVVRSTIFFAVAALALLSPALLLGAAFALAHGGAAPMSVSLEEEWQFAMLLAIVATAGYGAALAWARRRRLAWAETNDIVLRDITTPSLRWREESGDPVLLPREAA